MERALEKILGSKDEREFREVALSVFNYQVRENAVFNRFVGGLKIDIKKISEIEQIPFLPIEFFKTEKVITPATTQDMQLKALFTSSGTTGATQSKHYVENISVYEKSYARAFELFYGNINEYCVLALLPSYVERENSSLIYMVNDLIKNSRHAESGFYTQDYDGLIEKIKLLEQQKQKTILIGVTYALLELVEKQKFQLTYTTIMETGGMKGKRKEMVREELHKILCKEFGVSSVHSEYGMTELLSQAYSKGNGIFCCPPWMRVLIRDANDPLTLLSAGKTGGINVIDLANINSCSFIATQDLGKKFPDNSFEVLGRFDNSDIRGCNLLLK